MSRESFYDSGMQRPSIIEFAKSLAKHWKGSMSGGAGIFAALGALGLGWTNGQTFFWGAVTAFAIGSYAVWADQRRQVVALDTVAKREEVRLRLAELRTEGVGIRNEATDEYHYMSNREWDDWENRIFAWAETTAAEIAFLSKADAEWFKTLDAVPGARVGMTLPDDPYDGKHQGRHHIFKMMDYRLLRLDQLIQYFRAS